DLPNRQNVPRPSLRVVTRVSRPSYGPLGGAPPSPSSPVSSTGGIRGPAEQRSLLNPPERLCQRGQIGPQDRTALLRSSPPAAPSYCGTEPHPRTGPLPGPAAFRSGGVPPKRAGIEPLRVRRREPTRLAPMKKTFFR